MIAIPIVLFVLIVFFMVYFRSPTGKGAWGEFIIKIALGKNKANKKYVIHNLMIEDEGKTSQIDHVLINKSGIFVIETKNYSGRIYGNEKQQEWTQVLNYGKIKNKFYSPIKQNATHVYRLNKLLPRKCPIFSYVVFVNNNTQYIDAQNVIPLNSLKEKLRTYPETLTAECVNEIYTMLLEYKKIPVANTKKHLLNIKVMQSNIDNNICPRCGNNLISKQGKYGTFFGCSSYPKCKFIKK